LLPLNQDNDQDDKISLTQRVVTGEMTLERLGVSLPMGVLFDTVGKLNNATFPDVPAQAGFAAGIWLFGGANATEYSDEFGRRRWKAVYTFLFRSVTGNPGDGKGWNYVWRKDTYDWDKPINKRTLEGIYQLTDFKEVLK